MSKKELIKQTINQLEKLPIELIKGLTAMNINSKSFAFLNDEEDLYSVEDLKERFYQ